MAGKDKHPPLDSKRHSTNKREKPGEEKARRVDSVTAQGSKRVKPLGENIYGAPFKTAEGSKRVRPGDKADTGAKSVGPSKTVKMEYDEKRKQGIHDENLGRQLRKSNRAKHI